MPLNASNLFQQINEINEMNGNSLSASAWNNKWSINRLRTLFHWQWLCGQPCLVRLKGWDLRVKRCVYLHTVCMWNWSICLHRRSSKRFTRNNCFCPSTSQTGVFNLTTSTCPVHMSATNASDVFITSLTSPFRAVSKHQRLISLSSSSINQPEPCTAYEDVKEFNLTSLNWKLEQ